MVKAARFQRLVPVVFLLYIVAASILSTNMVCSLEPKIPIVIVGLVVTLTLMTIMGLAAIVAGLWLFSIANVLRHSMKHDRCLYMDAERRTVLEIIARPDNRWELTNHVVHHTGRHIGARYRKQLALPLQSAARSHGIKEIFAKTANKKVQDIYLRDFAQLGLRPDGPKRVTWP